jgi:hypothetical protein
MQLTSSLVYPGVPSVYRQGTPENEGRTFGITTGVPYVPCFFSLTCEDDEGGQNYDPPVYMWRPLEGTHGTLGVFARVEPSTSGVPSRYIDGAPGYIAGIGGAA